MKANELRIGNWLQRLDGGIFQVSSIDFTIIEDIKEQLHPKPIPITPEVLEKCEGFKKVPHMIVESWQIDIGRDRFISIQEPSGGNEMVFVLEQNDKIVRDVIVVRNRDYDGQTFLHHLQNIYSDFTNGKELQYKP